jgi:hypothetical protein
LDAQPGALTVLGSARINGDLSLTTNNWFLFGPIDENSDSVYFERLNPADNETQLRLVLGDDPAAFLDRFDIGTQTSTFHPILSAVSNGDRRHQRCEPDCGARHRRQPARAGSATRCASAPTTRTAIRSTS